MELDAEVLGAKARTYLSTTPRPFVKWAGSKRRLLPELVGLLPPGFGTYWEPFLGSGALFFLLQPRRARLSDSCPELMRAFAAVRDDSSSVLRQLAQLKVGKSHFYRVRSHRSQARRRVHLPEQAVLERAISRKQRRRVQRSLWKTADKLPGRSREPKGVLECPARSGHTDRRR